MSWGAQGVAPFLSQDTPAIQGRWWTHFAVCNSGGLVTEVLSSLEFAEIKRAGLLSPRPASCPSKLWPRWKHKGTKCAKGLQISWLLGEDGLSPLHEVALRSASFPFLMTQGLQVTSPTLAT